MRFLESLHKKRFTFDEKQEAGNAAENVSVAIAASPHTRTMERESDLPL